MDMEPHKGHLIRVVQMNKATPTSVTNEKKQALNRGERYVDHILALECYVLVQCLSADHVVQQIGLCSQSNDRGTCCCISS